MSGLRKRVDLNPLAVSDCFSDFSFVRALKVRAERLLLGQFHAGAICFRLDWFQRVLLCVGAVLISATVGVRRAVPRSTVQRTCNSTSRILD